MQLARRLPSAGGYYTYVSQTVGPRAGFLTAWLFFLYTPINPAIQPGDDGLGARVGAAGRVWIRRFRGGCFSLLGT